MTDDITRPFTDAVAEAERLIRGAGFIRTEQDLAEGYDYLGGRIRAALSSAFTNDPDRTLFVCGSSQFMRQGLDNPDALYFHAVVNDSATYVVRGRRGSTADLSFQMMAGNYTADGTPGALAAFDDREIAYAPDGSFELTFGPEPDDGAETPPNYFVSGSGASSLIVREVYNDWDTEERGTLWIERVDRMGIPVPPLTEQRLVKKYEIAGRALVTSVQTWFAFPQFFQYRVPVNTLTAPRPTPGGLTSQRSSIGHYELAEDEAMVVTVPECTDCAYQAIQIGSDWYVSTDYESHQTSLTKAQSVVDPDGRMRYVIAEGNPGVANWLEASGHRTGPIMLRWQRLERDLSASDGPTVEIVKLADVAATLPHFSPITTEEYAGRIAARQRSVARRMLS